ncbi:MAG: lipopolysaccharide heptosyltransferase [Gammaproteobacteria bacterium]|jgi:heptosyltransferase-1|nr:lipopolysaccharide heptosyltransferase [Gammaproteobacteria bacterium]
MNADAGQRQPERILLIRLSAIGDIVFASPLIATVRQHWPRASIAWLAQPDCAPLLQHHPDLDEVISWPLPRWRDLWRKRRFMQLLKELRAAVRALRARRFDLALDLQGLLKSALPAWLSGATDRIGLGSREGGWLLMTRVLDRGPDSAQIGSEYHHLAQSLALPTDRFRLALYPGQEAAAAAEALIGEQGLASGFAVICPFTTRAQKHWLAERWPTLAAQIRQRFGLPTLMLGGPGDCAAAAEITTLAGGRIINLVGQTSLLTAAALIERARLLVGVDTGLSHMGIVFRRTSVLLFGSTCPYTETGQPNARVLYHPRSCSPCRRRPTCDGAFTCMRDLEVDEVIATLAALPGVAGAGASQ